MRMLISVACGVLILVSFTIRTEAAEKKPEKKAEQKAEKKSEVKPKTSAILKTGMSLTEATKILEKKHGKSETCLQIAPPKGKDGKRLGLKEWKIGDKRYLVLFYKQTKEGHFVQQISLFAVPTKNSRQDTVSFNVLKVDLEIL